MAFRSGCMRHACGADDVAPWRRPVDDAMTCGAVPDALRCVLCAVCCVLCVCENSPSESPRARAGWDDVTVARGYET